MKDGGKNMSNLHEYFKGFNENISLTKNYKTKIRTGRDALREKINNHCIELDKTKPNHAS